jgi:hypothetical protein
LLCELLRGPGLGFRLDIDGREHRAASASPVMSARRIVIEGPIGEPLQVDGDNDGRLPATIEVEDRALTLVYP